MIYLSNSASSVLDRARGLCGGASEFGYRFQHLVAMALKAHPSLMDLYENLGAGQPDCFCNDSGHGFEIKTRADGTSIPMDDNSWIALPKFSKPRLVALLTLCPPYPLWVVDLTGMDPGPVSLSRNTPADTELEEHLKIELSSLVESIGASRICTGSRDDFNQRASALAAGRH